MKFFRNLIIVLVIFSLFFIFYYNRTVNYSDNTGLEQEFYIESGQSFKTISKNLKETELIKSKTVFKIYVFFAGKQGSFRSGSYSLSSQMNIKKITTELTKPVYLKPEEKITLIEGWNLKDYARVLEEKNLFSADEFLSLTKKSENIYLEKFSFLKSKPQSQGLEGYLFPDTYRVFTDIQAQDFIEKMLDNFDRKLTAKMRLDIEEQGKNIHEIIIMASIVEKEVRSEEDMKIVSGIFWNRIKIGQALESCATLAYILGVNKAQYSFEETRTPSPYNTYINRGLPPGPISNPGLRAIEASIYPEETDYNYFLSASETGETIFSKTYEEHLVNKNKYIK